MRPEYTALYEQLGIAPLPDALLRNAFTHRSSLGERNRQSIDSNERLEFLGDAVLQLAVSHVLYMRYPEAEEGHLTSLRAQLVCRENLVLVAQKLSLGELLLLGKGERKGGGEAKPSLLSNAVEALLGACYLVYGYEVVAKVIEKLMLAEEDLLRASMGGSSQWKTRLQELAQKAGPRHIEYRITKSGPDHQPLFGAHLFVDGDLWGHGLGKSRQEAEQDAAKSAVLAVAKDDKVGMNGCI